MFPSPLLSGATTSLPVCATTSLPVLMPFKEVVKMDERRVLAIRVMEDGWSISRAAREFGVSRQIARKWVRRAGEVGIAALYEGSRRPHRITGATEEHLVQA